eukprot:SAG31_NODE_4357_length_3315_cov_2.653918_4_plen_181_part_00
MVGCTVTPQDDCGRLCTVHVALNCIDSSTGQASVEAVLTEILCAPKKDSGDFGNETSLSRFFPGGAFYVSAPQDLPPPTSRDDYWERVQPWRACPRCNGTGVCPVQLRHSQDKVERPIDTDQRPLIAIVDTGIGGSALALALQQRCMRVVVFERDARCSINSKLFSIFSIDAGLTEPLSG